MSNMSVYQYLVPNILPVTDILFFLNERKRKNLFHERICRKSVLILGPGLASEGYQTTAPGCIYFAVKSMPNTATSIKPEQISYGVPTGSKVQLQCDTIII